MESNDKAEKNSASEFRLQWGSDGSSLNFGAHPSHFDEDYEIPPQDSSDNRPPVTGRIIPSHTKFKSHIYPRRSPTGHDFLLQRKLREAANGSDTNYIQRLINAGVNPSGADSKQRTALHFAATQGNERMVKLLLDCGANPNARDTNGNTPLHLAACTNRVKIVTLLLKAGTDLNAVDYRGRTPLEVAKSTLRVIYGDESVRTVLPRYKEGVLEIVNMLKEYMARAGMSREEKELNELCCKLDETCTVEQVDQIHGLLSSFTSLSLSHSNVNDNS